MSRAALSLALVALLAATVVLLTACGGGDVADDLASFGPPDCRANPEACR